jgi:hypothetical protein
VTDHVKPATPGEGFATNGADRWPATVAEALARAARRHPDRPFLLTEQDTWTFSQVEQRWGPVGPR